MYRFLQVAVVFLLAGVARAQITETPVTVQPGHFLLEMDAISVTVDHEPGQKYTAFGVATTFLTTGLTSRLDLQVGAEFFINQKYESGSFTERRTGMATCISARSIDSTSRPTATRPSRCCPT